MIGIHDCPGSFSDRWMVYCEERGIPFRRVDCLATDIVRQCEGLAALLWHWSYDDPRHVLVARQIINALELKGLVVFPNARTCWHYDDKVAQKYLLEAIGAPLIPTWVFTDKVAATRWIAETVWPKVFKLRCGAGSTNVRLVRSREEAAELCRQAFGEGLVAVPGYTTDIRTRVRATHDAREFRKKLARAPRLLLQLHAEQRQSSRERGYVYFQEFLDGNAHDTRITIIGNRAFGFVRANRPGDFRASGSGSIVYDPNGIDGRCTQIAFRVAERIGAQSLAFDFLFDSQGEPMIGEISYAFQSAAVHACAGYWDHDGAWHAGHTWPEDAILEDVLAACGYECEGPSS